MDQNRLDYKNRMLISDRAHLVTQHHLEQDALFEKSQNIGTTKRGIGPAYSAKIQRYGLRVGDLKDWDSFKDKY